MAVLSSSETESQDSQPSGSQSRISPAALPRRYLWAAGAAIVLLVLIVSLATGGPGMDFPTTVSTSEVPTTGGNTITIEKSLREATGEAIDDGIDWLTEKGSWLFDGVSDAITYSLVYIETVLEWVPWPAMLVGLAVLSFAVI